MARVLVTGGAGFIGSRYVRRAVRRGDDVIVLDNLWRPGSLVRLEDLRADLGATTWTFVRGSVTDAALVAECCDRCDVVVHLAGQVAVTDSIVNPRLDFEVNALGTLNVLEALRTRASGAVLIHASTNKVYGSLSHHRISEQPTRYAFADLPHGVGEREPLDPQTPYACSNAAADQYVRDYARLYGVRGVVFRQSCIYGPGQFGSEDQGWVAWLLRAALRQERIGVFGDGKQVRDLLHVDDLLDAFDAAIARANRVAGEAFNVGGGMGASLSVWCEFGDLLAELTGCEPAVEYHPWRPSDQRIYVSDIRRAQTALDWRPAMGVRDGLRDLCDWLKARAAANATV